MGVSSHAALKYKVYDFFWIGLVEFLTYLLNHIGLLFNRELLKRLLLIEKVRPSKKDTYNREGYVYLSWSFFEIVAYV